jgi:DNA polymerase-3 subunit delta
MFFLLHGPDEFSAREELARLRQTEDFGYSQDTFAGADGQLDSILATCDTLPFLSERRLVVVEGLPKRKRASKAGEGGEAAEVGDSPAPPEAIAPAKIGGKGKKAKAASGADPRAFAQGLAAHVSKLPESTVLVVLVDELLEATNPLVQAAQKNGTARAFTPPKGAQLEDWLAKRASVSGARLMPHAARLLASEVGDNLRLLASEIEKLSTYVGQGGTIRVDEVRLLSPSSRQARVFDLTDALARRDHSRALALLHELLAAGESPLGIVAMTAYQTRTLMQVKSLAERGLRPPQIAQTAGMAPFVVDKTLPLARQFSFAQLEAAHRTLLDVDRALKSSRMTPEMALDLLVVEFGKAVSA